MGNKDITFWYKKATIGSSHGFAIWMSFWKIESFFLQNLSWSLQNGIKLFIGFDPIFGFGEDINIPPQIIQILHRMGIFTWSRATAGWQGSIPIWKNAYQMGLKGIFSLQWTKISMTLRNTGICFTETQDILSWKGKSWKGNISVKDIYSTLTRNHLSQSVSIFPPSLWKNGSPYKIIIFSWLVLHNKNLTWENLQKRKWTG